MAPVGVWADPNALATSAELNPVEGETYIGSFFSQWFNLYQRFPSRGR